MVDAISSCILKRQWDTIDDGKKSNVVFLSIKVNPVTSRLKVTIVQIAWLALFDNLESATEESDVATSIQMTRPCITPLLKLMAYEDPLRLFEVFVDDFIACRTGPIDAVIGILPLSCPTHYELSLTVYDDRTTSQKLFAHTYFPTQMLEIKVKIDSFYNVQPLWKDTIIPVCNSSTSLLLESSGTSRAKLLCAIFDPWVKLNLATATSFRMPDQTTWPPTTKMRRHCIDLPNIEQAQMLDGAFDRTKKRNDMFSKELVEAIWNPIRLERLGMFRNFDQLEEM